MFCMAQRDIDAAKKKGLKNGDLPELPALFRDAGWATLNHTTLSTSNCGNPALRLFGFGAVVPDGFGIGYIVRQRGAEPTDSADQRRRHFNLRREQAPADGPLP